MPRMTPEAVALVDRALADKDVALMREMASGRAMLPSSEEIEPQPLGNLAE